MQILRADGYRTMPWKNGGGSTTEIAVSPDGAGFDDFDWRISMALVSADGPFSLFPGVDRTLAILDGAGLVLHGLDTGPVRMTRNGDPFPFPADAAITATLVDGPITDLNVMARRGRFGSRVRPVRGQARIGVEAPVVFVLADAPCRVSVAHGRAINLGSRDALRLEGTSGVSVDVAGEAFLIELLPG